MILPPPRVVGVALYTGAQTKLMMNQQKTRAKQSRLEKAANSFVVFIFVVLAIIVSLCALMLGMTYGETKGRAWYLCVDDANPALKALEGAGTFLILFNNLIPISLYVSMEMCKIVQAQLMELDVEMYWDESDTSADAKSSSLNEELGQIQY
eukprot:gene4738-45528_t